MSKDKPRGIGPKAFRNAKALIAEVQGQTPPAPKPKAPKVK